MTPSTIEIPRPARSVQRYSRQASFCKAHSKPGYRTRRKALQAAERTRGVGVALAPYRCRSCGHFHLTSDTDRAKLERAREKNPLPEGSQS